MNVVGTNLQSWGFPPEDLSLKYRERIILILEPHLLAYFDYQIHIFENWSSAGFSDTGRLILLPHDSYT